MISTLICFVITISVWSQADSTSVLSFSEYLGYVKKFHPIAKQAELTLAVGQANLMKARGAFDPKIEFNNSRKRFKDDTYYDLLNTTFKIPTWYGIELKGQYEQNDGVYLNPQNNVPEDGLYSAGISAALGQGLWINKRMADLKKAKYFREQTEADREILINQILYDASVSYFNWLKAYRETLIYQQFLNNAEIRLNGVKRSVETGDKAAIDSIEARITIRNRRLGLEQSKVALMKASLELSTFLWLNDNIPVELQSGVIPDLSIDLQIDAVLEIADKTLEDFILETHPKLKSLNLKYQGLEVDKRLKANQLLPTIDVQYNFLTETPDFSNSYNFNQYKAGIQINIPLFLRKERGELQLAKFKLQDLNFDINNTKVAIQNKVIATYRELESYTLQNMLIEDIVSDYDTMLSAEERKFSFGESSLFLVNTRERLLIESQLKAVKLQNDYLKTKAKLFNNLSRDLTNL
ncbi:TolC family protein [Psychroserpens sp. BH13MA-6]